MFSRIGRVCVRHRRLVLVAWLALIAAGVVFGSEVFSRLSEDTTQSSDSESGRGAAVLRPHDEGHETVQGLVENVDPTDPAVVAAVTALADELAAEPHVETVTTPYTQPPPPGPALVSENADALLVEVELDTSGVESERDAAIEAVGDRLDGLTGELPDAEVKISGDRILFQTANELLQEDLTSAELIALPITLLVMILVFGGFLAAGMPLIGAVASIAASLLGLLGFSTFLALDPYVVPVVTMVGLGLAIDYSLLVVNRFREERRRAATAGGDSSGGKGDRSGTGPAVIRTVETAGRTITFSAITVAISLCGLFAFTEGFFRAIGAAGIAIVLLALLAGLTLIPALLASYGHRISAPAYVGADDGRFARIARVVQRRPWVTAVGLLTLLLVLGAPVLGAKFQNGGAELLPTSAEPRQVAERLADDFPGRGTQPITVVGETSAATMQEWADTVRPRLPDGLIRAVSPAVEPGPGLAVVQFTPYGDSQGDQARELVRELREHRPAGVTSYVTGGAAFLEDFIDSITSRGLLAFALVVVATFVLLFLMTGSVLIPLKALVMNTLSLGASFGALKLIFQDGWLSGLLGFTPTGAIETFVPVLVFAFAFGLSMDYEVFLLARIKEEYDAQPADAKDNDAAVRLGLQRSGRIITSAALLIVIVFAGFAAGEMLVLKELGVALALAVVVDVTIVRCLLVPATMTLLGRANWWAPPPLRRLHERLGLSEDASAKGARRLETADH